MTERPGPQLRRSMGLPHATAMVVGTIIGASIFVQPSEITSRVPSIAGILLVWALSGVLTLFGALVCAELASAFPESGGVYVFLNEAFSPALGFLWGWAMFWSMHSGIIAAIAVVFARYVGVLRPAGRYRDPSRRHWRRSSRSRRSTTSACAREAACRRSSPLGEAAGDRVADRALGFVLGSAGARTLRSRAGPRLVGDRPARLRARARRRALRLRRLAHGDLLGGRDRRSAPHDPDAP